MRTRLVAGAGVLVSALVHLKLWFDGVRDEDMVGPAFMANAVGGIVIVVLLLTWQHWVPLLLTVGFAVSTIGGYVIAATVGLYGVHENWTGGWAWTALISEAVALVAGVLAAWQEGYLSRDELQHQLPVTRSHLD